MPLTEAFELDAGAHSLHGFVTLPDRDGPRPTVVICHGFKGFMEWGFFPALAELLAERGFTAVRFNFHGNGMSPGDDLVTDAAAFRHATFGGDLDDLGAILDALGGEIAPGRVDRGRFGVVGHSRGGGIALLGAASRPEVKVLVTWAAVSDFDRLGSEVNKTWREQGEVPVVNARTGQTVPVDVAVLEDLQANRERYDLVGAAASRRCPWLLVHGSKDETVPVAEAQTLREAAAAPAELLTIAAGDHTFGGKHPFAGPTRELIEAMNATQAWFLKYLRTEVEA